MKQEIADYLDGQIEAVRKLSSAVADTLALHCPRAAKEFKEIEYACNRTSALVQEQVGKGKGKEQRGKENL